MEIKQNILFGAFDVISKIANKIHKIIACAPNGYSVNLSIIYTHVTTNMV